MVNVSIAELTISTAAHRHRTVADCVGMGRAQTFAEVLEHELDLGTYATRRGGVATPDTAPTPLYPSSSSNRGFSLMPRAYAVWPVHPGPRGMRMLLVPAPRSWSGRPITAAGGEPGDVVRRTAARSRFCGRTSRLASCAAHSAALARRYTLQRRRAAAIVAEVLGRRSDWLMNYRASWHVRTSGRIVIVFGAARFTAPTV